MDLETLNTAAFQALKNLSGHGVLIVDAHAKIIWCNEGITELSQYTPQDLQNKSLENFLCGQNNTNPIPDALKDALEQEKACRLEVFSLNQSGEGYWANLELTPITEAKDKLTGFICLLTDITEKKQLEQKDYDLAKALDYEQMQKRFLALINHELRTPLNPILAGTELLLSLEPDSDNLEILQTIHNGSHKLKEVIEDLLLLSELDSRKLSPTPSWESLHELVNSLSNMFSKACLKKNLQFDTDVIMPKDELIYIDKDHLFMIAMQLLANAIKFTPSGSIKLNARTVSNQAKQNLIIKVSDTGIGIHREKQQIIFDAFRQSDEGTRRHYQGLGIGLTIVKELTQRLNGTIKIDSSSKGTSFTIELPIRSERSFKEIERHIDMIDPEIQPILSFGEDAHVLVVDDDISNQQAIKWLLEAHGIRCAIASNGKDAVEFSAQRSYDVIIMDITMPKLSGIEATLLIREHCKGSKQPYIIAYAADCSEQNKQDCLNAGIDEFLVKPCPPKTFISIIHKHLVKSYSVA